MSVCIKLSPQKGKTMTKFSIIKRKHKKCIELRFSVLEKKAINADVCVKFDDVDNEGDENGNEEENVDELDENANEDYEGEDEDETSNKKKKKKEKNDEDDKKKDDKTTAGTSSASGTMEMEFM
jgi:hypothetical protein